MGYWQHTPPVAHQLKRIAMVLGLPASPRPTTSSQSANSDDALREALAAGLPLFEGRPDDPLLDFLDLKK